jgi:hypothetical protein
VALHRIACELKGIDLLEPGVLVGREHAVGFSGLRQHLAALQVGVVLEGIKSFPGRGAPGAHPAVAFQGLGLVVVVGKHGLYAQAACQCGHRLAGHRVQHDQPNLLMSTELAQRRIQLHQRRANELHAPVGPGQRSQNFAVKNKDAMHLLALGERTVKGRMIVGTQVATKPDESGGVSRFHVHR